MIAKSDVVILVISASALAAGIYRWQSNMAPLAPQATIAQTTQQAQPVNNAAQNTQLISAATTQPAAVSAVTVNASTSASAATGTATNTNTAGAQPVPVQNPVINTTAAPTASASAATNQPLYGVYVVQSGDFLGKIAEDFNTTVETLRTINGIEGSLINVGQEISYPLPAN